MAQKGPRASQIVLTGGGILDVVESSSSESVKDEIEDEEKQYKLTKKIVINREEYLQTHRDFTLEKSQAQFKNNILHRRLAEYYRKRKLEHVLKPLEHSLSWEEKFQAKLLHYEALRDTLDHEIADINSKVSSVKERYSTQLEAAEEKFDELTTLEHNTGRGLIYSKKGKPISDKTVERHVTLQKLKTDQACALRLRYIRVRNAVSDLEAVIRSLEEIAPGLYVRQYEQLVVDLNNCTNKCEGIEDDLIKNRGKCQAYHQVLAHIREKMHHTDEVIDMTTCDLGDTEIEYLKAREKLGTVKTRRDRDRINLRNERIKAGLLTRKDLLRDYQDGLDEVIQMRHKRETLENQIEKTTYALRETRNRMINARTAAESTASQGQDY